MYLQTSRLQYNLQGMDVFQTARSDKNIQALACRFIISTGYGNAIRNSGALTGALASVIFLRNMLQ